MKWPFLHRPARLVALAALLAGAGVHAAEPVPISLYHKDPNHLWNRLYSSLMARAPEPDSALNDLLDPPFWDGTKLLLDGATSARAVVLLGEFVNGTPRPESMSAIQRAVMQRDLLAIHHWLVGRYAYEPWPASQRELARALVRAILSVALTPGEIRKLPDNYAAAVAAPGAVTAFDPAHPGPFLPKDLMADDGPWIALARKGDERIVTPIHFKVFRGRSAFEVRMKHAGGRAAGEACLDELAAMPKPLLNDKPADLSSYLPIEGSSRGPWANPDTPQFPPGTMWALVRRAILADAKGAPVVSPLVESVQIRVYRALGPNSFEAQTPFEWETHRALLLGKGGFHLTTPAGQLYAQLLTEDGDPFQAPRGKQEMLNCFACHTGAGIHSVLSRSQLFNPERLARPPEFSPAKRAALDRLAVESAAELPGWYLLKWLWN